MSTKPQHFALVPRDGFFAKDGRGWSTSARTHVVDWPWPTTIRGALTTASGKLIEQQGWEGWGKYHEKVRLGRLLALRRPIGATSWGPEHRMWPVPADALWVEGKTSVLRLKPKTPETPTLGRERPDGMPQTYPEGYEDAREALWVAQNVESKAKPLGPPRWWDDATLVDWLCGECVKAHCDRAPKDQFPSPARRFQVHVGIRSDTLTGDDGILFAHDVIETLVKRAVANGPPEHAEWAIGVEVTWPVDGRPKLARLGSDSRIAWVKDVQEEVFSLPTLLESAFASKSQGLRLMVATPTLFAHGWLPDGFKPEKKVSDNSGKETWEFRGKLSRHDKKAGGNPEFEPGFDCELILRAAFVPRPMHVSGWDMASDKAKGGAPRATSRLVPPGAVYFFTRAGERPAPFTADDAQALWLAALGGRTGEGFGRVVPGIWNPEDTE
jgi:CRISPR-associated protein Cmr3